MAAAMGSPPVLSVTRRDTAAARQARAEPTRTTHSQPSIFDANVIVSTILFLRLAPRQISLVPPKISDIQAFEFYISAMIRTPECLSPPSSIRCHKIVTALGMTSYVLIGAIAGATNLIPYVGTFVGAVLTLLVPAERYSSEETASRSTTFCRGRWSAGQAGDDERLGRVRQPHVFRPGAHPYSYRSVRTGSSRAARAD